MTGRMYDRNRDRLDVMLKTAEEQLRMLDEMLESQRKAINNLRLARMRRGVFSVPQAVAIRQSAGRRADSAESLLSSMEDVQDLALQIEVTE